MTGSSKTLAKPVIKISYRLKIAQQYCSREFVID
jgi:hypothetical protein